MIQNLVGEMPCNRTSGPTGSTSQCAVCKIVDQLPTKGATLFKTNGVAARPRSKELDIFSAWEDIGNIWRHIYS